MQHCTSAAVIAAGIEKIVAIERVDGRRKRSAGLCVVLIQHEDLI